MKQFNCDLLSVGLDCKGAHKNFLDTTPSVGRIASADPQPQDQQVGWGGWHQLIFSPRTSR
jgi:hypothetical protein